MFHVEQIWGGEKLDKANELKEERREKKYKKSIDKVGGIVLRGCDCFWVGKKVKSD